MNMKNRLDHVINNIENQYQNCIAKNSRHYIEVEIGKEADALGYPELKSVYRGAHAVVPLKKAVRGMKVRIDGRTFVNYAQFESGIAVPGYVAKDSQKLNKRFIPQDSMILNFN
jgi:hypothetical protein